MTNPSHLVVRYSDTMFAVGDVIAKHNAVVSKQGAVWFGKLGIPLAQSRVDLLNRQIHGNTPTFLYLIKGNRRKSTAYRAKLLLVSRERPREKKLVPAYYDEKKLIRYMKVWMKIGKISPIDLGEMSRLRAISSIYPITETLAKSSSGYFLVHECRADRFMWHEGDAIITDEDPRD